MGNRLNLGFTFSLVLGLAIVAFGAIRAPSPHSSARGNTSAQGGDQNGPAGRQEAIGHAGDVVTYHYNIRRQGQNTLETVLTPANVNFNSFGKVNFFSTDGKVDAQPLYVYQLPVGGRPAEHTLCSYRA